jgi:HSP20 family protein
MAHRITRWNPGRELAQMHTMMDRVFDDNWRSFFDEARANFNAPALDVTEQDNSFVVSAELPGVKAENINVKVENNVLFIEGEIPEAVAENKDARQIVKERRYGRFSRMLRLPEHIDHENVEATYGDGVLQLTLPKSADHQPKVIPVKAGASFSEN